MQHAFLLIWVERDLEELQRLLLVAYVAQKAVSGFQLLLTAAQRGNPLFHIAPDSEQSAGTRWKRCDCPAQRGNGGDRIAKKRACARKKFRSKPPASNRHDLRPCDPDLRRTSP